MEGRILIGAAGRKEGEWEVGKREGGREKELGLPSEGIL